MNFIMLCILVITIALALGLALGYYFGYQEGKYRMKHRYYQGLYNYRIAIDPAYKEDECTQQQNATPVVTRSQDTPDVQNES